jgi:hypothetical protein
MKAGKFTKLIKLGRRLSYKPAPVYEKSILRGITEMYKIFQDKVDEDNMLLFIFHDVLPQAEFNKIVSDEIYKVSTGMDKVCNLLHLLNNNKYNVYTKNSVLAAIKSNPKIAQFVLTDINSEARYTATAHGLESLLDTLTAVKDELLKHIGLAEVRYVENYMEEYLKDYNELYEEQYQDSFFD